ncbi:MAG: hypothetical protein RLP15_02940 [Cryomorphaceae bacterium]
MRAICIFVGFVFILLWSSCNQCRDGCVNGVCIKRTCQCDLWYEGDRCDRSALSQHVGYYRGTLVNDTGSAPIGFHLVVGSAPHLMLADSLGLELQFADQARFDVAEQGLAGEEYSGEGEMLIDLISIRLDPVETSPTGSTFIEAHKRTE